MKNILIVEDEVFLVQVLKDNLASAGFSIDIAMDGESALAKLRTCSPDLLLLDLLIPKLDGFHVLDAIRADEKLKCVPVFVISNLSDEASMRRAMDLGAEAFYVKSSCAVREIVSLVIHRLEHGKTVDPVRTHTCPGIGSL